MTPRKGWAVTWLLVLATLLALLAEFVAAGDNWRTFWISVTIVCLFVVRRDFVRGLQ